MNINDVNSWRNFKSWQSVTPPSRPDNWQLSIIENELKKFSKKSKIAVLGSTIEFRDLLAKLGYNNVFVFERNLSFYNYISNFSKFKCEETVVAGNWIDTLSEYRECFDVVLSDLTSGNIPYSVRNDFYRDISNSLVFSGIFIDRILTKSCPFVPLDTLINKYEKTEITNQTVNSFNCEVLFCSTLLENPQKVVDTNMFYDYLISLNKPRITEFVKACYEITPRNCIWWYSLDWKYELNIYKNHFNIKQEFDEPHTSEYFNRAKLLISERRLQL